MPVATSSNQKSSSTGKRPKWPPHSYSKHSRNLSRSLERRDEKLSDTIILHGDLYLGHGPVLEVSAQRTGILTRTCHLGYKVESEQGMKKGPSLYAKVTLSRERREFLRAITLDFFWIVTPKPMVRFSYAHYKPALMSRSFHDDSNRTIVPDRQRERERPTAPTYSPLPLFFMNASSPPNFSSISFAFSFVLSFVFGFEMVACWLSISFCCSAGGPALILCFIHPLLTEGEKRREGEERRGERERGGTLYPLALFEISSTLPWMLSIGFDMVGMFSLAVPAEVESWISSAIFLFCFCFCFFWLVCAL